MEVTTVDISYENMQSLTKEAITVARQCHVDSCLQVHPSAAVSTWGLVAMLSYDSSCLYVNSFGLNSIYHTFWRDQGHGQRVYSEFSVVFMQALFVLGDMALVTYDLPEAQRILNIVALTAADGQVRFLQPSHLGPELTECC